MIFYSVFFTAWTSEGGGIAQMVAFALHKPAAPGSNLIPPEIIESKFCCLHTWATHRTPSPRRILADSSTWLFIIALWYALWPRRVG